MICLLYTSTLKKSAYTFIPFFSLKNISKQDDQTYKKPVSYTHLDVYKRQMAILVNNAFKTVQQSAKDKEDICRRADARQRYLTQDFTL